MRFAILVAAALAAAGSACAVTPVGDALQRPALKVKAPERGVLLSAAQAGQRIVAVGERGLVVVSDDRGDHWRQMASPVSVTLTMVRFADDQHGVAVGHGGVVLTTRDAGETWVRRLDGRTLAELAQAAANTPQARQEADRWVADGPDKPFLDVLLWDAKRMLAVGAYGLAFYSDDAGESWTPWMSRLPNPRGLHWYVVRRMGDTVLLAGEQALLALSNDAGQTFQPLASPYKGSWFAGEMLQDGTWVLGGLRGNVWQSTDQGQRWTPLSSPVAATVTAMTQQPDGALLMATQAGVLLRRQGVALQPMATDPLPMPAALLSVGEGRTLSLGVAGVVAVEHKGVRP